MSDALEYLIKARPDAMAPYFKFLKETGKHLDPKTRNLISVITKVHSQTERGFRQYLTRALRDGASPHEILDAILMAFPALGLAKIVWAIDILLAMDMPEFHPDNLDDKPQWHVLAPTNTIKMNAITYVPNISGRSLFIYRDANSYRVYDSRCPHQVTNIPHLALEGQQLTCPKHQWKFDICTGACIEKGNRPLKQFESKIENDQLLAYW